MKRLLLMITMSLMTQINFAQNAPTSTHEGAIIIDKPVPGGLGFKVEGGKTWLHNDDNGVNSSVLELGIHKDWNAPNFQIFSADGGGHNNMTTHGGRWGSHFRWTRGSNDGRQFIASIGGDDNFGQYLRLYGTAPDTANVIKIQLRSKGNSYLNTNGNLGLGTDAPTEKLDVNGGGRFRNVPHGSGNLLMIDGTGKLWQKAIPGFLYENGLDGGGLGDNLGNHCAEMDLDMKCRNIVNVLDVVAKNTLRVGDTPFFNLEIKPEKIEGQGNITIDAPGNINLNSGNLVNIYAVYGINMYDWLNMNMNKITNLDDPTNLLDAVNKAYVDNIIAQLQAEIENLRMRVETLENE